MMVFCRRGLIVNNGYLFKAEDTAYCAGTNPGLLATGVNHPSLLKILSHTSATILFTLSPQPAEESVFALASEVLGLRWQKQKPAFPRTLKPKKISQMWYQVL